MSAKLNAAPKAILQGVRDESGGQIPVIPEQLPTHLPHVFTFAEKGTLEPQLVVGDDAIRTYGAKTFDPKSKYATHQTPLINILNGNANAMVVQRLKPEDAAPPATAILYLEMVEDDIETYERNEAGEVQYNQDEQPIKTGETVTGYKLRWVVEPADDGEIVGRQTVSSDLEDTNGNQGQRYPIMGLRVSSFGSHGNLKGFRLYAPTANSPQPASDDVIDEIDAFLYRIQFVERPDAKSQANVIETIAGSRDVEFSFKEGAINPKVDQELYAGDAILDAYRDLDASPRQFGPFNDIEIYQENIETVLETLFNAEKEHHEEWPESAEDGKHLVNILSGQDVEGVPYQRIRVQGKAEGGVEMTRGTNHYAGGGNDGTMTFSTFDSLVANECANYGDLEHNFLDTAKWPQSVIYDTGFTLETKKKLLVPMGRRKDMATILSTQDVSTSQNTAEEESSIATSLRAAARLYPESEVYGTPVCRALVVGHSGYLINSQYKKLAPMTLQIADMCARFMGAANGEWQRDRGFDIPPYNQVTMFKDVNATYKPQNVYNRDWENGLVWVQNFDRRTLFFPGIQTVYDDSTSVLNSAINMFIVLESEKVAERAWRQLTGISKLTRAQFIDRSNELITEMMQGRFDDRVIVQPDTYFTDFDDALGYSWSCDITLYLNNMRTVGSYTIIARRRSDFDG